MDDGVSVFLNARSMAPEQDRALIRQLEGHATRAAGLGFDAIFLPDHHFNGYMPVASDSFMFAAYLAAKLPDMHFGFSVTSVPLHHPAALIAFSATATNPFALVIDAQVLSMLHRTRCGRRACTHRRTGV